VHIHDAEIEIVEAAPPRDGAMQRRRQGLLIVTMSLRRIKISRPGFFILGNPNSLSPKKKREHNNAWRQRQHDTKNDRLNCSHRRPRAFDSANLLLARSACIVGFLHVNRNARPPGLIRSRSNAVLVWNEGLVFLIPH
jgi:hypothetical protein